MRLVEYRLADPGAGSARQRRRVLTYADLRSLQASTYDQRIRTGRSSCTWAGNMEPLHVAR